MSPAVLAPEPGAAQRSQFLGRTRIPGPVADGRLRYTALAAGSGAHWVLGVQGACVMGTSPLCWGAASLVCPGTPGPAREATQMQGSGSRSV